MKVKISRRPNVGPAAQYELPAPTSGGALVAFLEADEREKFEKELGLKPGALNFHAPVETNLWFTDEFKFRMIGQTIELDTNKPKDNLMYKLVLASNQLGDLTDEDDVSSDLVRGEVKLNDFNVSAYTVKYQHIYTSFSSLRGAKLKKAFLDVYTNLDKTMIPETENEEELNEALARWFLPEGTLNLKRIGRTYGLITAKSDKHVLATVLISAGTREGEVIKIESSEIGAKKPFLFKEKRFAYGDLIKYFVKGLTENLEPTMELLKLLEGDNG